MKVKNDSEFKPVELNSGGFLAFVWRRALDITGGKGRLKTLVKEAADREYIQTQNMTPAQASKKENELRSYAYDTKLSWDKFLMLLCKVRLCKDITITIQFKLPDDDTEYIISQDVVTDMDEEDDKQQNTKKDSR